MYSASVVTDAVEGPEVDLILSPSKQSDFSSFWSSSSLGKAVLQGRKLRNEKPRYMAQNQCDVINIDYIKTHRDYRRRSNITRRQKRNVHSPQSNILLRSGLTTYNQKIKPFCQPKQARKKGKSRRRCPLRIAELAIPSKRQCLDTWRSKYPILPDYMVERLKQHVLDQRPIVKISDAIYCFKTRPHRPLPKRMCKKRKNLECISNYFQAETKTLCAIFGHKIALYLNKPMAVSLTPRLERISKIVSDEIWYLLRKKIRMNKIMNQKILYETAVKVSVWMEIILEETTYKLQEEELADLEEEIGPILDLIDDLVENALDICVPDSLHSVLSVEESKESSLTEDYEEKAVSEISFAEETHGLEEFRTMGEDYYVMETENQKPTDYNEILENEDIISISNFLKNEIHDIILNMNDEYEGNLKEENIMIEDGSSQIRIPEIDTDTIQFLDSVDLQIENERSLPIPEDVKDTIYDSLSKNIMPDSIYKEDTTYVNEQFENKDDTANLNEQFENKDDTDYLNKQLENQDDTAYLNEQLENKDDTANLNEQLENKDDIAYLNERVENRDDAAYLNKQLENKDDIAYRNERVENTDDTSYLNDQLGNKTETADLNDQLVNKDDTANIDASAKPEQISEEQDEDNNKKVKFSDIDMGTRGQLEIHSDTHLLDVNIDKEKEQVSWKASADNIKSSIIFAPPNENLLSDADESWPENIPSPVLRPSESISRSVTSLGRILETEEKFLISSESDDVPKNYKEKVDQKIRNTIESLKTNGVHQTYENKETDDKVIKKKRKHDTKEKTTEGLQKSSFSRDSKKLAGTRKASPPKTTKNIERPKDLPKVDNKKNLDKYSAYSSEVSKKVKKDSSKIDRLERNKNIAKDRVNKPIHKKQPHEDSYIERAKSNKETSRNQIMQHKRDYKVNEATAPNWLKHKRADVHKDLTFGMNQTEIRKWCKNLDREFGRFEIWNDWLKCMLRNFINLHQSQAVSKRVTRCDFKRWIKFQRNLDRNVCTWTKLHRRTQHRLNQTIYICVKPSGIASPKRYPSRCSGRSPRKSPSSPDCSRKYFLC